MAIKQIITALKNQKSNLSSLLNAARQKQSSLVNFKYEELEDAILKEEKLIVAVQMCENARIVALKEFYEKKSLAYDSMRISELLERSKGLIDEDCTEKLKILEKEIKTLVMELSKINLQNKYLVEHSRAFIRDTVTALANNNKTFLDKRV